MHSFLYYSMHEPSFGGTDVPARANEPAVAMVTKAAEAEAAPVPAPAPTPSPPLLSQLGQQMLSLFLTNKPLPLSFALYPSMLSRPLL